MFHCADILNTHADQLGKLPLAYVLPIPNPAQTIPCMETRKYLFNGEPIPFFHRRQWGFCFPSFIGICTVIAALKVTHGCTLWYYRMRSQIDSKRRGSIFSDSASFLALVLPMGRLPFSISEI